MRSSFRTAGFCLRGSRLHPLTSLQGGRFFPKINLRKNPSECSGFAGRFRVKNDENLLFHDAKPSSLGDIDPTPGPLSPRSLLPGGGSAESVKGVALNNPINPNDKRTK